MRALALAASVAALAGCTEHQTEMILVITTEGVRIPDDVHKVHLSVADRLAGNDDIVYDADVELCTPSLSSACYNMPVTAALFPGKSHGSDSVRVQVTAIGATGPVIDDAALFTFADQQSLRLDFVLYANCLGNVECAQRDQACGPLDTCIDIKTGNANGGLDIALPTVSDMAGCGKLNQACCHAPAPRRVTPNAGPSPDGMVMPPDDMSLVPLFDMISPVVPDMTTPPPPDLAMPLTDMAMPPPPDLAMSLPDLAMPPPPDLAMVRDMATPRDLAMGGGGGGGGGGGSSGTGCDPGLQCVNDTCVP